MRLLAIDDLELSNLDMAELPLVTDESDDLVWSTQRQPGRQSQSFVGGANEPATYDIAFPCNSIEAREAILGVLTGDLSSERRLLAARDDSAKTRVITHAAVLRAPRITDRTFRAILESADSIWMSERSTTAEKTLTDENDQALHVPLPGMLRVSPTIRINPLAQRTTKTLFVGWSKRRRYTITNNADEPLYRYPLRVDLGSTTALVTSGFALASGNDVRLVIDGIERSRSLITWNTAASYMWFIVPSLQPGDSMTIEIWYGNASAGVPPLLAYPSLPPFNLSTSTNASWVFTPAGAAGLWNMSKAGQGAIADTSVPGAWQFASTLENPDSTDRIRQLRATDMGGGSYAANLDAWRGGSNSTQVSAVNDFDGVALYNPLGILSITNGFTWTNVGGWSTLVLIARDSASEGWQTFFTNAGVSASISSATRSPSAAVKWIAAAVWPDDPFVQLPPRDDTANTGPLATDYARAVFSGTVTVAIDSSQIAIDLGATAELPWTPATLGGKLKARYNAITIQGVTSGSGLDQWDDSTANHRNATQNTSSERPIYRKTQITGLPAVDFDGSNDRLGSSLTASSRDETILAVIRPDTSAQGSILGADEDDGRQLRRNADGTFSVCRSTGTVLATSTGTIANGAAGIVAVTITGTTITFSINGTVQSAISNSTTFAANRGTKIGCTASDNQQFFNGLIGEVGSSVALSSTERQSWEGYAAWTWGLVSLLPVGHPYKALAPTASGTVGAISEDDIYEIATRILLGGGDNDVPPFTELVIGNGLGEEGEGTRRLSCLLSEAILINASLRTQEIWLADLTLKTEDISAHAVRGFQGRDVFGVLERVPTPDWLPMIPNRPTVPNGSFDSNISGWEVDESAELITAIRDWDGTVGGEDPGSYIFTITANTDAANEFVRTVGARPYQVAGRESIWVSAWVMTNNAVLRPRLYVRFYDEDDAVLTTISQTPFTPTVNTGTVRVMAAQVPGRAQYYRIGLSVRSTTTGNLGSVWFDDIRLNDNDLSIVSQAIGQESYAAQVQGLWL